MLSVEKLYLFDAESDDDGSNYGSAGTCAFPFRFDDPVDRFENSVGSVENSVGRVCGVGYGVFVPIRINLIGDIVPLVIFVPI